jgi:hypothetical protein
MLAARWSASAERFKTPWTRSAKTIDAAIFSVFLRVEVPATAGVGLSVS